MAAPTTFDRTRTYGVEIEFTKLNQQQMQKVARDLTAAGLPCEYEGYNHHDSETAWKIVYDGSVRNPSGGRGWELVSPILKGIEGLEQIKLACKILAKNNADVNKTCGLHVHHGAKHWTPKEFVNLHRLYARMEPTIDSSLPKSRRASKNFFCRSVREEILHNVERFEGLKTMDELRQWTIDNRGEMDRRYGKINMESWWRHDTVEFRQHSGTIEADKIINWIVFTQLLVQKAEGRKVKMQLEDKRYKRDNAWRLVAVELALHNKGSEMDELVKSSVEFIANRINHFRNKEQAA
jgi:hypothetical protein